MTPPRKSAPRNVDAAYAGKLSAHREHLRAALREIAESKQVNTAGLAISFRDIARRALVEDDR